MNHLVLDDPRVSRMHAWIDRTAGGYVVTDMRSRTGTLVNGQRVSRRVLRDGDTLQIGQTQLKFTAGDELPAGAQLIELPRVPALSAQDGGIRFDCPHCHAPMWAASQYAGFGGICTYCSDGFTIPRLDKAAASSTAAVTAPAARRPATPAPVAPRPAAALVAAPAVVAAANPVAPPLVSEPAPVLRTLQCGVCHSSILPGEPTTTCPNCHVHFHAECWEENYGCSSYGCPQVNVLAPPEPEPAADEASASEVEIEADLPAQRTPKEFLLLGLSVLGVVISAFTFGAASLLILIVSLLYWRRSKDEPERNAGAIYGAMALSVVGLAAGVTASYFVYRLWKQV